MDAPVSNYCRSKETVNNKTKTSAESFYFCQKMEFRTYILRIFIHSLVNSKSNELPQSLGGRWCFLLLLSSPFLFFLGFKVIFKIFKLCGMAKQTNKQTNKQTKWSFGFFLVSDTSYNTYIPVVFFTIVFTFLPPIFHWDLSLPYRFLFTSREKCPGARFSKVPVT